jgi:hypothetical protein
MHRMATIMNAPKRRSSGRGERGQAIILFVGIITVIFVIAAIVIDFGLWFAERRAAQRGADLAATAGAPDLPLREDEAFTNACKWAQQNGFEGDEVTVEFLSQPDLVSQWSGRCSEAGPSAFYSCAPLCDSLRVTVGRPATRLFTTLFGMLGDTQIDVGAVAVAGLRSSGGAGIPPGGAAGGAVLVMDASGTMEPSDLCNSAQDNDGCPMQEARDAANAFVDLQVGGASQQEPVGYVPFNYCYNPPWDPWRCIPEANVVPPTTDSGTLHDAIDATQAGSSTNVCFGLLRAMEMFDESVAGQGSRVVVLVSDGDNNDHISFWDEYSGYPPGLCRPGPPTNSPPDPTTWRDCTDAWNQEVDLDGLTWDRAEDLKDLGVEIFVIGYAVCGSDDGRTRSAPGYCDGIGDDSHDDVADQRLLKCIASSPDHYFRVASAQDLTETILMVADELIDRGLLQ